MKLTAAELARLDAATPRACAPPLAGLAGAPATLDTLLRYRRTRLAQERGRAA